MNHQVNSGRFLLVGDTILDFVWVHAANDKHGHYLQYGGGAIANVARHLADLGAHTELMTAFAPDPFGTRLKRALKARGVGLTYARTLPDQETPLCFISNAKDGERFFLHRGGDPFGAMSAPTHFPQASYDWFVYGISSMRNQDQRFIVDSLTERHKGLVVCDPGTCPSWWGEPEALKYHLLERLSTIHILKCSQPEAQWLSGIGHPGEAAIWLAKRGATISIVTAGGDGLYYSSGEAFQHLTVQKVHAIDTTGAGDATLSGLLAHLNPSCWRDENHLRAALEHGMQMGAATVQFQGAGPWRIG